MSLNRTRNFKFDWITIILFLLLVGFGWINIVSASSSGEEEKTKKENADEEEAS